MCSVPLFIMLQGEMIQVLRIHTEPNKHSVVAQLNDESVTKIVNSNSCRDLPFLVISINGLKRSGKSFLMNLFISFLKHLEDVSPNFMVKHFT